MRKDKEQATVLRKSGMTYSEIKAHMGVPKSTLSDWFRNEKWSNDIAIEAIRKSTNAGAMRLVVLNTVRGNRLKKVYEEAVQDAVADYHELKFHPLFISGVMIYWGEGNRVSKHRVSIANTDPGMIKIFRIFLERICGMKNIKAWMLLYPDLDEKVCKEFWTTKCGLKAEQFTKTMVIQGRSKTKRLSYGVCNIGLSSAYLKSKILKWIELLSKEIGEETYLAGIV